MVIFYKKWKKYNELKLINKMNFNNRKIKNHPPSPTSWFKVNSTTTNDEIILSAVHV